MDSILVRMNIVKIKHKLPLFGRDTTRNSENQIAKIGLLSQEEILFRVMCKN
jgi:hypothetical protein